MLIIDDYLSMLFRLLIIVISILQYSSADLSLAITSSLTTNQLQYGYNITINCRVIPDMPVYHLNISFANSTQSWLAIDSNNLLSSNGGTAQLSYLSETRDVIFVGHFLIPARRSALFQVVIIANWTDASGSRKDSVSATSDVTLTHSSNIPPIIDQIKPLVTTENSPVLLQPSFSITDEDFFSESDEGIMTLTLSVLNTLSSLSLDPLVAVSHGAAVTTLTKNKVRFLPAPNWFGTATLNLTLDDHFNGGIGGFHVSEKVFNVTVQPHNQAPSLNSTHDSFSVLENGALGLGNHINFFDIDAADSDNVTLKFIANYGRFYYSFLPQTNASYASHSLTVYGPYSVASSVMGSVYYHPPTNWITTAHGFDTVTIEAIDVHQASYSASFVVYITRHDALPKLIISDSISVYEDSAVAVPISINDTHSDLGRQYFVSLSVTTGSFSLASLSGLNSVIGQTNLIQFFATSTDANSALNPLIYKPDEDINGNDMLTISLQADVGLWTNRSIPITIHAINDAPRIHISPTPPLVGGSDVNFNLTVVDVDDNNVTVTLDSSYGTFSFRSVDGLNITGSTLTGPQEIISAVLSPVNFVPYPLVFGMDCSVSVLASDKHAAQNRLTIPVYLSRKNTPPSIAVPKNIQAYTVNATVITSVSVSDYEDDDLYLTCKAVNGSVSLSSKEGLYFFAGSGFNDKDILVFGNSASINNALYSMTFLPDAYFVGNATLELWLNDTMYSAGPKSVSIIVTQTKTAPNLYCPESLFANENQITNIGSVEISDSSMINPIMNFTASASSGVLLLPSIPNQLVLRGNNTRSLTLYGPYIQVSLALAQLQYLGALYFNSRCCGPVSLIYNITGHGLSNSCRTDILINPINNVPIVSTCEVLSTSLRVPTSLAACINLTDPDAGESIYSRYKLLLQAIDGSFHCDFVQLTGVSINIDEVGSHHIYLSGPINRLHSAVNQHFITYNGSPNKPFADVINIVVTDLDVNKNVTSELPVTLLHNPAQILLVEGLHRTTLEDTAMPIDVTVFGVNSLQSWINLTIVASVLESTLDLLPANNVSVAIQSSSNNITLQILITESFHNFTIVYTPAPNWNSGLNPNDVIVFQIEDQLQARLEVSVTPVNDAPTVLVSPTFATAEDASLNINVTVADVDLNDAAEPYLSVSVYTVPETAILTLGSLLGLHTSVLTNSRIDFNGSLERVNEALQNLELSFPLYHGNATIFIWASDNGYSGADSVEWTNASSLVTISHVNHPPSLTLENVNLPILTSEDTITFLNFTLKDSDDNSNVAFTATVDGGLYLNATISGGVSSLTADVAAISNALQNVSIRPKLNWNGFQASLSVSVSDGQTLLSKTVPIIVLPEPDAPVLNLNCSTVASVNEDHYIYLPPFSLLQNIADPDYDDADILYRLSLETYNGTIAVVNGDVSYFFGSSDLLLHKSSLSSLVLRYQPLANFNGRDSLRIVLNDTTGTPIDIKSCPISVLGIEDPVVISLDDTINILANTPTKVFANVTISRVPYESDTFLFCNVSFRYGTKSTTIASSTNISEIQYELRNLIYTSALNTGDYDVATISKSCSVLPSQITNEILGIGDGDNILTYSTAQTWIEIL